MVIHRSTGQVEHRQFRDLPEYLHSGDCMVLNKTRVLPAKFEARRETGGRIEGLFIAEPSPGVWHVLLKGVGRLRDKESLVLSNGYRLSLVRRLDRGECEMRLEPAAPANEVLSKIGSTPLPPYIERNVKKSKRQNVKTWAQEDAADFEEYQTVYASVPGAVAAPTAGLHFTTELLERIHQAGVCAADLVLHVGLGTFQPIEVDDLSAHVMHREWYSLPQASVAAIRAARSSGGRIIAVGTTSVRVLETCSQSGSLQSGEGWTNLFIYPPYEFRAVDMLITNFHLPGSTLLALVAAWMGAPLLRRVYQTAIDAKYRFYSYGDAMLIL